MKKYKILLPLIPIIVVSLLPWINNTMSYKMELDYNVPSNIPGGWIGYVVIVCVIVIVMAMIGCLFLKKSKMSNTDQCSSLWKGILIITYIIGIMLLVCLMLLAEKTIIFA